jgi:Asp-tRNA(Asn)/Glu-tRNA(Gln) amidotransferase A subunit family amidase
MSEPYELTAASAAQAIADGRLSATALIESCLARIAERETLVGAWQYLDADGAREQARALDRGPHRGALHGVPLGVKDMIDTADMPTGYGSALYNGHRPPRDAACVARLKSAGAIILGKTVMTELAYFKPGKTANPRHPGHTPGGSSSGSAAAVADSMVPAALATQTAGSVVRPASFCGAIGYKPSFGHFNVAGVKPFSPSLDTLGLCVRAIEDLGLLRGVLFGAERSPVLATAPRIGLCRTNLWTQADAATHATLERVARQLEQAGATITEIRGPADFGGLTEMQKIIMDFEAARSYAHERQAHGERIDSRLRDMLDQGLARPVEDYLHALSQAEIARRQFDQSFDTVDAVLTPAVIGEAPAGLEATGDPLFNRAWTLLHAPALSLPLGVGPRGLPIGVQLIGQRHADTRLIAIADWVLRHADAMAMPVAA